MNLSMNDLGRGIRSNGLTFRITYPRIPYLYNPANKQDPEVRHKSAKGARKVALADITYTIGPTNTGTPLMTFSTEAFPPWPPRGGSKFAYQRPT